MRILSPLRTLLSYLFKRNRIEREMDDEFRSHLEMRTAELARRGLSQAEAERQARIEFGGYQNYKEECRETLGTRLLQELVADIRYGLRQLRRNPGFTAVAVLTLALGIGANTAIFSMVRTILISPLPYHNPDQLLTIWNEYNGKPTLSSPPDYLDRRSQGRTLQAIAALRFANLNLSGNGPAERLRAARVTASFFAVMGIRPEAGRTFTAREDAPGKGDVAVLSHGCWQRRFGANPGLLGTAIRLNGKPYTVLGVMPPDFSALFPRTELWIPIAFTPQETADSFRGNESLTVLARRKPQFTLAQVRAEMKTIAARVPHRFLEKRDFLLSANWSAAVVPLREHYVGNVRPALLVLFTAVMLVLLIACVNVANLLLARASGREREMALRSALGAGRGRVVRQLLVESVLLSGLGGAAGLLLARWGVGLARRFGPGTVPLLHRVHVDIPTVLFLVALSVLVGILFGLAPVFRLAPVHLRQSFKERSGRPGRKGHRRVGGALVALEIALSLVLLAGTGLLIQSLHRLLQVDPGFESAHRLTFGLSLPRTAYAADAQRTALFREVLQRLQALPGVTAAGAVQSLPFAGDNETSTVHVEGRPVPHGQTPPSAEYRIVTPGYRRAMGIPLLSGRDFSRQDTADSRHVALVDAMAAKHFWPSQNPIGKRFSFGGDSWREVVGVVGTVRNVGLDVVPHDQVYLPYAQHPLPNMHFVLQTGTPPLQSARVVRETVSSLDRDLPVYDVRSMDQVLETSLSQRQSGVSALTAFALAALLLAAIGIYGVMAYSVNQRTHEIGIRMALGAKKGDVLKMVVGQGLKLALIGVVIGIAGALALTRFLSSLLYGVKPTDPLTFIAVSIILIAVALVACYIPARRAAKVDPMVALRYE
jgi:putative ABC transport system permease protein